MLSRRSAIGVLACGTAISAAGIAAAKQSHHRNGHALLGARIKQNGKHNLEKAGKIDVSVDVRNSKVAALTANDPAKGNLGIGKFKSNKKMAAASPSLDLAGGQGQQLAQVDVYYAYCFTDGIDEWCYWFDANDVLVDTTWQPYIG